MPTYDYRCDACGHVFEHFQAISSPLLRKCPACGKPKLKRLIGAGGGLLFKGSGFYITDYRSSSYHDAAKKDAAPSAPPSATTPPASTPASPPPTATPAKSGESGASGGGGRGGKESKSPAASSSPAPRPKKGKSP